MTHQPLDLPGLLSVATPSSHGARIVFEGVVRNHAEGRPVQGMRYEGYEPMALEVLQTIVDEAETGHAVGRVDAAHRLGELEVGETSVVIVVSGPHRDAAYRASRYVIEEIKKRLPVWKHEHFTDGEARWVPGTPLEPSADSAGERASSAPEAPAPSAPQREREVERG